MGSHSIERNINFAFSILRTYHKRFGCHVAQLMLEMGDGELEASPEGCVGSLPLTIFILAGASLQPLPLSTARSAEKDRLGTVPGWTRGFATIDGH